MTAGVLSFGFTVLLLVGAAVLLAVVMYVARGLLHLAPISRRQREALSSAAPAFALVVAVVYAMFAARTLFHDQPNLAPVMVAAVLVGLTLASWGALRDVLSGVYLRIGRVVQVGDQIRVDGASGRVKRLGIRLLVLETSDGEQALLPYTTVARERVTLSRTVDGSAAHVFTVAAPSTRSTAEVRRRIRQRALLVHWAALAHEPAIVFRPDGRLEITVFAIHPEGGREIEAAVRQALERDVAGEGDTR
jgi:small-conductance mechanosensitive channel